MDVLQVLVKTVLKNPFIWGMALTYFFIYVVRQGVTSWCAPPRPPAVVPATKVQRRALLRMPLGKRGFGMHGQAPVKTGLWYAWADLRENGALAFVGRPPG